MKVQASISIKNNNVGYLLSRKLVNATVSKPKTNSLGGADIQELNMDISEICADNNIPKLTVFDVSDVIKDGDGFVVGFVYKNKPYWINSELFSPKFKSGTTEKEIDLLIHGKDLNEETKKTRESKKYIAESSEKNKKVKISRKERRVAREEDINKKFDQAQSKFQKLIEEKKKELMKKNTGSKIKKTKSVSTSRKKATFVSKITKKKVSDILVSTVITHLTTKGTRTIVSETSAKLPRMNKFNIPGSIAEIKNKETKKIMFRRWYGCFIAAAYFQTLVSNTPMDEEYSYNKETFKLKAVSKENKKKFLYGDEETVNNVIDKITTSTRKITHNPDNDYVRGDWILYFRDKTFKAFETRNSFTADYTFSMDDFFIKVNVDSIIKIASILYEETKNCDIEDSNFITIPAVKNINKRCEMLDKGGFYKDSTDEKTGPRAKYTHGVSSTLLTYQAPKGFIELSQAYWKEYIETELFKGTLKSFLTNNKYALDVSKVSSKDKGSVAKNIVEKYPEIEKFKILREELSK